MDFREDYLPWTLAIREEALNLNPNGCAWGLADRELAEIVRG